MSGLCFVYIHFVPTILIVHDVVGGVLSAPERYTREWVCLDGVGSDSVDSLLMMRGIWDAIH